MFDPVDPTPVIGGTNFDPSNAGPRDQRRFESRNDVIVFSTNMLTEEVEICGYVRLVLYVSTDAVSTDFVGRLCVVFPNKMSVNVCDGIVRIENVYQTETLSGKNVATPLKSIGGRYMYRLSFEIGATAYSFLPGHRIRVQVCSGAHGRWMRNLGTGNERLEDNVDIKMQSQQIFYGCKEYPSRLVLPRTNLFQNHTGRNSVFQRTNL